MREQQAASHYGPGGRKCPCCGPAPAKRDEHDRMVKRRLRRLARQDMQQQIREMQDETR